MLVQSGVDEFKVSQGQLKLRKPLNAIWLWCLISTATLFFGSYSNAQNVDSVAFNQQRTWLVGSAGAVIAGGTLIGLNELWYRDQPREAFHFFNDNADWFQMDKVGHVMTSYYMGRNGMRAMQWTGTERRKALWMGGLYGFAYLTAIEVLDGFSPTWGFSVGDMAANATGAAVLIGQEYLWNEQRMVLKYSAHYSPYAKYRPEVLGEAPLERLLKDYNGQSYWLSVNTAAWFREKPSWLPAWLNVAVGYSVDGLTGGTTNIAYTDTGVPVPHFNRQRQFYLSLDIDLTRIPTQSKVLRTCFDLLNFVKIPAPALEINSGGTVKGHWMYF